MVNDLQNYMRVREHVCRLSELTLVLFVMLPTLSFLAFFPEVLCLNTQRQTPPSLSANDSTNSRVVWWSIIELLILIAISSFQVIYLRRIFEKTQKV
jgi:hypothetical protein